MAWPSEAGAIAKVRGAKPDARETRLPFVWVQRGLLAAQNPPPWTVAAGVHPVRAKALEVDVIQPASRKLGRRVAASRFTTSFVGTWRIATNPEYRFYRSNVAPPEEGDTPFATSASLPHTPTDTFGNGVWYVSVSFFNGILDSGFLPLGENGETYLRLEISGGVVLETPPRGPLHWELVLRPAGVVRVRAMYAESGSLRAEQWAISYTTNGSTPVEPPASAPTATQAMGGSGMVVLEYDLPAQSHGTTVKVRLQTRRDDGGTWRYSTPSEVKTLVADASGPIAPAALQTWRGKLPEGV